MPALKPPLLKKKRTKKETEATEAKKTEEEPKAQTDAYKISAADADKVAAADALIKKIESGSGYRIEKKRYKNPDPQMYYDQAIYTVTYEGTKMVKVVSEAGEEGYLNKSTYYFNDEGKVAVVRDLNYYMENNYRDFNIYVENGEVYAAFGKKKEETSETPLSEVKAEFTEVSKAISQLGMYKERLSSLPKKVADAKVEK